jgi:hypothetical protein
VSQSTETHAPQLVVGCDPDIVVGVDKPRSDRQPAQKAMALSAPFDTHARQLEEAVRPEEPVRCGVIEIRAGPGNLWVPRTSSTAGSLRSVLG